MTAAVVLLWLGVALELVAVAGVLAGRGPLARLHFASLASVPGAILVGLAIAVEQGLSGPTMRTMLAVAFVAATSPALAAATARAAHVRREDEPVSSGREEDV